MSPSSGQWKTTVGLEIHARISSPRKLFSPARIVFAAIPNTAVDLFDAAIPGTQPRLNPHAVLLGVRAALAFNCTVNSKSTWDRKHYFYPDQPVGYQITQHYRPFAVDGKLRLMKRDGIEEEEVEVGIKQVQLEQDTGKTTYLPTTPPKTLVDLNRTGSPLIEIVTTPSMNSAAAAGAALKKIQTLIRAVGASDADMEEGGMRCDVNVSVAREGENERVVGPKRRCEIKNMASVKAVVAAVEAEAKRQIKLLESGKEVANETRGFNQLKGETFRLRGKEGSVDYRYMPDPDLPPLLIGKDFVSKAFATQPELPDARLDRLLAPPHSLPLKDARALMAEAGAVEYYETAREIAAKAKSKKKGKTTANWIVHELFGQLRVAEISVQENPVTVQQIGDLVSAVEKGDITGTAGKQIVEHMVGGDRRDVAEIIEAYGLGALSDAGALAGIVDKVLENYPKQVEQVRNGEVKVIKFLLGQVMSETRGKAKADEIEKMLNERFGLSKIE
ncbi:glutamyl-tRNA amidotransferase subunit B [Saitoella complicata NRRL Y-17804]|uniref:Glutamyl-tRNA(Gln) amidotransferase subunit B, mitochondrial n=1 Tax=Saitoella complicata (strain BCRC 22490 / CBS 7301 / JCM 7358 / NBRC 10748 / NRRL Y-17804) TaxID=698492 RepID=A0A0E9NQZ6_SAICN|nr:glutamyl-tRNA amidotransferase subunit B [Saitoella complicata NRRL Y-17804]ODQ56390.1 glutamyl-tRNA amidotransferase subunit B [Saitoella complicata NRRL Y-17804]GAO52086.1 hypothetical protein G7K_6172-t1 [Saitoella complicata NRRL Y-17804]